MRIRRRGEKDTDEKSSVGGLLRAFLYFWIICDLGVFRDDLRSFYKTLFCLDYATYNDQSIPIYPRFTLGLPSVCS